MWTVLLVRLFDYGGNGNKKNEGVQVGSPAFPSFLRTNFNILGQGLLFVYNTL